VHDVRRIAGEYQRSNPLAWGVGRAELQERLGHRGSRTRFGDLLEEWARWTAGPGEGESIHVRPDAVRVGSAERQLDPADQAALERLEALLREGGAAPPTPADLQTQLGLAGRFPAFVGLLEERGVVVRIGDSLLYHRTALESLEAQVRTFFESHAVMSMGEFKELTGLTRKYSVPLLESFDRRGITSRQGDNRVAGPRLRRGDSK
jgi:selenocysteine-specific elongation factor